MDDIQDVLTKAQALGEALAAHPLIGSYPLAKKLAADFIEAHKDTIGPWNH